MVYSEDFPPDGLRFIIVMKMLAIAPTMMSKIAAN
jgi:hypothetical protein